jgi:phospholipid transport system transporter-binding protein
MDEPRFERVSEGHWRLSGELSFETVPAVLTRHPQIGNDAGELQVDLAGVTRADSAGVALLVEWRREAQRRRRTICFHNIPLQMLAIARLSGVDELLALA